MAVSLCQMGLGQPTKTNTNNNTRPVIQLHSNNPSQFFTVAQVSRAVGRNQCYRNCGFVSRSGNCIFFMETISYPPKHN